MCYLYWFQEKFDEAIQYGEQGEFLLSSSGLSDNHSLRHNLALSRRDTKDDTRLDQALEYFLGVESIENIFSKTTNYNSLGSAFYGNIGRCLEFKGDIDTALKCYTISLDILTSYEKEDSHTKLNIGYACFWIAEVFIRNNSLQAGLYFLRYATLNWDSSSPPRVLRVKDRWNSIICDPQTKNEINSKAEWQIEKFCKSKIDEYINM